jgi:hypothetical protein
VAELGTKVRLSKIDPAYTGKHQSHQKALPEIQKHLEAASCRPRSARCAIVWLSANLRPMPPLRSSCWNSPARVARAPAVASHNWNQNLDPGIYQREDAQNIGRRPQNVPVSA